MIRPRLRRPPLRVRLPPAYVGRDHCLSEDLRGPPRARSDPQRVVRAPGRIYLTNSLYLPWDAQFYPEGINGWMARLNAGVDGGLELDTEFFLETEGYRPHQVHLHGGDASSDSYCFP